MPTRLSRFLAISGVPLLFGWGCQDYPFELREPSRVDAREINEVVAQLTPADILFVIDNSGSMGEEITELQNNLDLFLGELSTSDNQFQVGIITTDIECNLPTNDCFDADGNPNANARTSVACCARFNQSGANPLCTELDQDSDGQVDSSTCDGGRLRSATASGRRIFERPDPDEREAWSAEVSAAIDLARNNLQGSSYEAGLAAAVTAVACAVGDSSCPDPAVAQLNAGFIRPEADLVLIFLTDEDDCSAASLSTYERPPDINEPLDQRTHFCSAVDCYAYYTAGDFLPPPDGDGLNDLINEASFPDTFDAINGIVCDTGGVKRSENPPGLRNVDLYLDDLVNLKGDVGSVRGAGIISSVADADAPLGFAASGCFNRVSGPSDNCGCLAGNRFTAHCAVTERNGQTRDRIPVGTSELGGCVALPSGRYAQFLERLATRRIEASQASDVLIDSICKDAYDQTLSDIVNNVILSNCFGLGQVPELDRDGDGNATETISDILQLTLNGQVLPNVEQGSSSEGWSWIEGSDEVCLEGGLSKSINDRVEILLLASQ